MKRQRPFLAIIIWFVILAAIGTRMHLDAIDLPKFKDQQRLHHAIVTHTAPAPYQFRVLQPIVVEITIRLSGTEPGTKMYKILFLGIYAAIRFLSIFATFLAVFLALRLAWPDRTAALASTALAAFIPFTYRYYYYQPTSVLEMAFFGLGLLATLSRRPAGLLPLVLLGTLNRETMCFIPYAYALYWLPQIRRSECTWLLLSAAAWVLVFLGLRLIWPTTENLLDILKYLSRNLSVSVGNMDLLLMLSPAFLLLLGARRIPAPYWRLASCCVPWLLLHFFTSMWHEIRYYMPALIWLMPGLVLVISSEDSETKQRVDRPLVEQTGPRDGVPAARDP
tara:strand:+ start:1353 stop:2360 length:1008 start_codon:yes stop_codon:yes gene_type:complete